MTTNVHTVFAFLVIKQPLDTFKLSFNSLLAESQFQNWGLNLINVGMINLKSTKPIEYLPKKYGND